MPPFLAGHLPIKNQIEKLVVRNKKSNYPDLGCLGKKLGMGLNFTLGVTFKRRSRYK